MSEKKDDEKAIHGLSIVDATTSDSLAAEDKCSGSEDDSLVVKIEDEVEDVTDHDDGRQERKTQDLEEVEEKISLFDVVEEKKQEKGQKDILHNSTLIITTEEHLDTTTCDDTLNTSTETVKNVKPPTTESTNNDCSFEEPKKLPKSKTEDHCYFWVSNINRHVKAADLKKLFSQVGKVVTAKVLTNGKNYFGYLSVDSAETAGKCIKQKNNTLFEGRKIVVTKDRPDLRETKQLVKLESRRRKSERLDLKTTIENKVADEKHEPKKTKASIEEEAKTTNAIAELKKKLEKSKAEVSKYKWKVTEYQRRHEGMRKKCNTLESELKELQYKIRADRRRLNQDRDEFEKNKKMDLARLEADKTIINKELVEVKKLREHLKEKIDEIKAQAKKNSKRRGSRSPPPTQRSRSPRGRSPVTGMGSRMPYRSEDRVVKKRKHDVPPRGRTPPPPKLSTGVGKKRGENLSHRQFFDNLEKRPLLEHGYEYRHKPSFAPLQEVSKPPWQGPYTKDPRRMNAAPSGSQSYQPEPRFNGGYQFPPSNIQVPPRTYYHEFGKPYNHY